jgi:hydroxylaminobenzene mutase
MNPTAAARRLKFHGMLLFLAGLLTGFAIPALVNPRMGVAAHLEGVMNGVFLIGLGLVWKDIRLGSRLLAATFWLALYGAWVNWAAITLSAVWGTSGLTPLAGAGHTGTPWQEQIVGFALYTLAFAIVASVALAAFGLRGAPRDEA